MASCNHVGVAWRICGEPQSFKHYYNVTNYHTSKHVTQLATNVTSKFYEISEMTSSGHKLKLNYMLSYFDWNKSTLGHQSELNISEDGFTAGKINSSVV